MRLLNSAAQTLRTWMTQVFKMKSIYHTMNLFNLDVTQKCLIAECWCPVFELERIQDALKSGLVIFIIIRFILIDANKFYFLTSFRKKAAAM